MSSTPFPFDAMGEDAYPSLVKVMRCREAGTHREELTEHGACVECAEFGDGPTNWWQCDCGEWVFRFRGDGDLTCECGQDFNSSGQRLVSNWRGNPSTWDDEVSDLDGYEMQHAGDW